MSSISQQYTAIDGDTITAAIWNTEFANIINDYNGGITNANISGAAGISLSKLATTPVTPTGTETLSNKTFSDALTMTEISTPSNPAASNDKLYFKSDGKLYKLNSAGTESASGGQSSTASVYNSLSQSVNNASETVLTFDSEDWDTDSIHSTSSNTSRLTLPSTGKWQIVGSVTFASNSTGNRYALIKKNGTTNISFSSQPAPNGIQAYLNVSVIVDVTLNDYFELLAFQSSTGALNVIGTKAETFFMCHRMS